MEGLLRTGNTSQVRAYKVNQDIYVNQGVFTGQILFTDQNNCLILPYIAGPEKRITQIIDSEGSKRILVKYSVTKHQEKTILQIEPFKRGNQITILDSYFNKNESYRIKKATTITPVEYINIAEKTNQLHRLHQAGVVTKDELEEFQRKTLEQMIFKR